MKNDAAHTGDLAVAFAAIIRPPICCDGGRTHNRVTRRVTRIWGGGGGGGEGYQGNATKNENACADVPAEMNRSTIPHPAGGGEVESDNAAYGAAELSNGFHLSFFLRCAR